MENLPVEILHMVSSLHFRIVKYPAYTLQIISRFEYSIPYDARFDRTASKYKVTTAHARPIEWKSDLESLRSLRLTCRTLSAPTTRFLFNVATVAWYPGDLKRYPYLGQSLTDPAIVPLIAPCSPVASWIRSLKIDFSATYKAPSWFTTPDRVTSCFEIPQDDGYEKTQNLRILVEQLRQVIDALPKLEALVILSGSWESKYESDKLSFAPVLDLSLVNAFEDTIIKALKHASLVHLTKLHLQLPHFESYYPLSRAFSMPKVFGELEELYLSVGDGTAQDFHERLYLGATERKS